MSEITQEGRSANRIAAFFTVALVICGMAFFVKLFRFASTIWRGGTEMLGFALLPVTTYLLVASGFFMLLLWAFLRGQFSDIERAKYELLEDDARYEAAEHAWRVLERRRREP